LVPSVYDFIVYNYKLKTSVDFRPSVASWKYRKCISYRLSPEFGVLSKYIM
jgi:hypothetical protein